MKILLKTIFLLFLFLPLSHSFAQSQDSEFDNPEQSETQIVDENTKKITNKYFDLTLEKKPQSAFGKYIPYILTITPHINSSKTQILWNVPSTISATPKHKEFVSLEEGEIYTFNANIKPLKEGTYDFSVSVISWQYDTNYTNSIDDTLTFNANLVLQPVSQEYQIFNTIKIVSIFLLFILICLLVVKIVKRYMIKAKKWLTPPY